MIKIHVLNIEGKTTLPIHGDGKTVSYAAGYDVVATDEPTIVGEIGRELTLEDGAKVPLYKNIQYLEYHTALKIAPQDDSKGNYYHVDLRPRSSVRKYNLVLANSVGTIDCFSEDSAIHTDRGPKTIHELKVNDIVYSANENLEVERDFISAIVNLGETDILQIETDDGVLEITMGTMIYTSDGVKRASDLTINDKILHI